jgi:hypothetical protein
MPCYPMPSDNPHCECWGNPMRAFFCPAGRMLECHFPYNCMQAGCSHLGKYDIEAKAVEQLEQLATERLRNGELHGYRLDNAGNAVAQVD